METSKSALNQATTSPQRNMILHQNSIILIQDGMILFMEDLYRMIQFQE